ncbi:acyl-CoA N-acyltransferase [Apiospora aurea]|uniref:Acyl-CoA N-acyltransferase n=1 Tax=Apiospora aurea TaxID=335848 RepID=A0ABR1PX64_9PEZI
MAQARAEPIKFALDNEEFEGRSMMPWFSYKVSMPVQPMPGLGARAPVRTKRLVLRPFVESDLDAFHELRSREGTQRGSMTRGRASRSRDESQRQLADLLQDDGQRHWYFAVFLQATGELVGEVGLPDCVTMARSGWPEAEVLVKKEFWRQGYGTEMLNGWLSSWWALPREIGRHQLFPLATGWQEPGAELIDGVGFGWEETNTAASGFFHKALSADGAVFAEGFFEEFDQRDGREPQIIRWNGIITSNPNGLEAYRKAEGDNSGEALQRRERVYEEAYSLGLREASKSTKGVPQRHE